MDLCIHLPGAVGQCSQTQLLFENYRLKLPLLNVWGCFILVMYILFRRPALQTSEINNRNHRAAGLPLCVFYTSSNTVFTW